MPDIRPTHNNPAGRLHRILTKALAVDQEAKKQPAPMTWAKVLEVPVADTAAVLQRFGEVLTLPNRIKEEVLQIPDQNHDLFLRWMPTIQSAFALGHLNQAFGDFLQRLDSTALYGLEICADLLSQYRPEVTISDEELYALHDDVTDLMAKTQGAGIDPVLKRFLLGQLVELEAAIKRYHLFGIKPLQAAMGSAIAAAVAMPQVASPPQTAPEVTVFWRIIGRIAQLVSITSGLLRIGDNAVKLLPDAENPIEIIISQERTEPAVTSTNTTPQTVVAATN